MVTSRIWFTAAQKAELWERWKNGQSATPSQRHSTHQWLGLSHLATKCRPSHLHHSKAPRVALGVCYGEWR
jgi:hypothetical protein